MINMIILVVFALIGLVVGYLAISIKLSKAKEQAETTLLKAEQDAVNLRSQAEHDADHLRVTAERESKAQRKEFLLEAKEEARKYREDIEKEFKSERQELKQMENLFLDVAAEEVGQGTRAAHRFGRALCPLRETVFLRERGGYSGHVKNPEIGTMGICRFLVSVLYAVVGAPFHIGLSAAQPNFA